MRCRAAHLLLAAVFHSSIDVADAGPPPGLIAVAWLDETGSGCYVRGFTGAPPWSFETPALNLPGFQMLLRHDPASGRLLAVSPEASSVVVIDVATWQIEAVHSMPAGCSPVDVAVVEPVRAYVSCQTGTHLLRLDLDTGQTTPVVDLSGFADADGIPDMNLMAEFEGRLFVQLQRQFGSMLQPPAMIAVVDVATEQIVDADSNQPGDQAIVLAGTAPKLRMEVVESSRRMIVSSTGTFHDAGGIELVDLDALASLGFVEPEQSPEPKLGADGGPMVMLDEVNGLLIFSTDFPQSSHLVEFSLTDGVMDWPPALFDIIGYFATTLALDQPAGYVYVPDGSTIPSSVQVLDTATYSLLSTVQLTPGTTVLDVIVIPRGVATPGDCDGDGDVDVADYVDCFAECLLGPVEEAPSDCAVVDFDGDQNVDLKDFAAFAGVVVAQ